MLAMIVNEYAYFPNMRGVPKSIASKLAPTENSVQRLFSPTPAMAAKADRVDPAPGSPPARPA
ncbi:hypothetical protein EJA72_15835 [Pseudomonas sp. PB120]|nr:hypothetical protein [Pseudomonas sp. PB120]